MTDGTGLRVNMNMNAYHRECRERDGTFPFFANHVKGTFGFLHLIVEIVIHIWFKHFVAVFRDENGLCHVE